ncbi:MAG: hypothetical protein WD052_13595 [Bacteroidales bacterium]
MKEITNSASLKEVIQILEAEQTVKGHDLKDQFRLTYESLKPINIIREAVNEFSEAPGGINSVFGTGVGLLTGFLSRKVIVGNSGNLFRRLLGSYLQFSVSNAVANHSEGINNVGRYILELLIGFADRKSDNGEE